MIKRGVVGYLLVLLGGLIVSVLPESTPVAGLPLVSDLRGSTAGRMVGLTVVVAGLGLAGAAWLELVRLTRGDGTTTADERLAMVRRAAATWSLPLLVAPAMFSRDGWSYAAQGEMVRVGISPYEYGPGWLGGELVEAVDPMWMWTLTPYGPIPLLWGALAGGVTGDPWLLVLAHRLLALAGLAMLAYAVPRMARWSGHDPARASALVLASPFLLAHGVAGLHNDVLMVGVMAVAVVVAVEHHWLAGAVAGGLAAAVKLPGGLACLAVVLLSLPVTATVGDRLRRGLAVAAASIGTLGGVGLLSGLGVGWVHALDVPGVVRTPLSLTTQLGRLLAGLQDLTGIAPIGDPVSLVRDGGTLGALGVAVWLGLRAPTGVPGAAVRALAHASLAVVVLGSVVHHWYALWTVPFLAAIHLGPRATAALVAFCGLAGLVAPLDSSLNGAMAEIGLTVALVAGVAIAQSTAHRRALDRQGPAQAVRRPTEDLADAA
ncbi:polyprenol phosphomannose-dependent alpha 1,6 mannosyltransferase MptB [Nocardioides ferulae]|uniref:polyprenol phosphomannose-dependent alpha 1,6 mannosyltransferase MptB n=1 Tax=Nocardioides ferulae TaxID=2340821 RepID=UPI000EB38224|nr:polyprenol phosphomannose-dependent alpha 1,6 mannosyltransferase MptB [Nocardioides ferulae]